MTLREKKRTDPNRVSLLIYRSQNLTISIAIFNKLVHCNGNLIHRYFEYLCKHCINCCKMSQEKFPQASQTKHIPKERINIPKFYSIELSFTN